MPEETIEELIKKHSVDSSDKRVFVWNFKSPVGEMVALADDKFLYLLQFLDNKDLNTKFQRICRKIDCRIIQDTNQLLGTLKEELRDYFDGRLKKFTIATETFGSDFQMSVWNELTKVPFGTTQSYGDLAVSLHRGSGHARAVGAACGANPLLVVVPCHRLVAGGSRGGYSAGGDRKAWLIDHERNSSG